MGKYQEAIETLQDGILFSNEELDEALELAYQALEKQAFFENEVSNIHGWFVDYKDEILDTAIEVAEKSLKHTESITFIDEVDLEFIVEDIVDEIHKIILNVLSTYVD